MKAEVMKAANFVIEALLFCEDVEFTDSVIAHMVDGVTFDEEEIRAVEEEPT